MSNSDNNTVANGYIKNSMMSTSIVVIWGLVTKVVSLAFTMSLARIISKESYGIAKVYFEFIFILILYFPRETIRKTVQKYCPDKEPDNEDKKYKEAVQLCWFLNIIFMFISIPVYFLFIFTDSLQNLKVHVLSYVLCANLELFVEPIMLYNNIKIDNTNKYIGLTLANYSRLFVSFILCYFLGFDLWSFTLSRIISTAIYCIFMIYVGLVKYKLSLSILLPDFNLWKTIYKEKTELMEIFNSFIKTNILKMILTYTEKTILSFFLKLSDEAKAEYSFITDNFGIIIQHVLQPVEENFFNFVNKIKNFNQTDADYSKHMLSKYLRIMMIFGTLLIGYIFVLGKESITFVYTEKWSNDSSINILKVYSIYVAIIAMNGIIEAHSNAIFTAQQMERYNVIMTVKTFMLIIISIISSYVDITGLIYANGICMIIRIMVNLYFTFGDKREIFTFLRKSCYNILTLAATLFCLAVLANSKHFLKSNFFKVFYGAVIFVINILVIFVIEKNNIKEVLKPKLK
jgi:oligosaccharide translocation protein RFT1